MTRRSSAVVFLTAACIAASVSAQAPPPGHPLVSAYPGSTMDQAAEVSAFNPQDKKEYRWPSWQLLNHLVNHSSHHRAEAGLMLASLGHSPGDLDYIYFVGQQG